MSINLPLLPAVNQPEKWVNPLNRIIQLQNKKTIQSNALWFFNYKSMHMYVYINMFYGDGYHAPCVEILAPLEASV